MTRGSHPTDDLPFQYSLSQNYPNPFNPTTTISFDLAGDALVSVKVYNTLGQEIATIANKEEFCDGTNELEFNAGNFSSCVYYYYRIIAEGLDGEGVRFTSVKKMLLIG